MKMNKIVASVSAAALAVSALATNAFAAGPYVIDTTHQEAKQYNITLSQTIKFADTVDDDPTDLLNELLLSGDGKIEIKNRFNDNKKLDVKGDISINQSIEAKATINGVEKEDTVGASGSAKIDVVAKSTSANAAKTDFKVTGGSKLLASDATIKKDKASTEVAVDVSFSIPVTSNTDINDVIGMFTNDLQDDIYAATALTRGLVVKGSDFADLYEDEELTTTDISDKLECKITLPKTANSTVINDAAFDPKGNATVNAGVIEVKKWKVTEFEVEEKTVGVKVNENVANNTYVLEGQKGFTIPAFADLANGGTMTLKFSKAPDAGLQYVVRALLVNDKLNIEPVEQNYTVDGDSITFKVPAGFTYDAASDKYGEPTVYLQGAFHQAWNTEIPELMSISFAPSAAADVAEATTAPTANQGDEVSNTPAATTTAAATTAAPAGDTNPGTGVAIAIVPAIVAAAGVIISKKRK